MEQTLLVATSNKKKGGEMLQILAEALPGVTLKTLADFPPAPEVEETGETFIENARLKALAAAERYGLPSIADDGGLVIDALGGEPGVKSRRFLGEETSFEEKMEHILHTMRLTPEEERACRFRCAVVIALPGGIFFECEGICEGRIAHERKGAFGFGYDPIFFLPELGKQMAELTPEEKHKISHRGRALALAAPMLQKLFSAGS